MQSIPILGELRCGRFGYPRTWRILLIVIAQSNNVEHSACRLVQKRSVVRIGSDFRRHDDGVTSLGRFFWDENEDKLIETRETSRNYSMRTIGLGGCRTRIRVLTQVQRCSARFRAYVKVFTGKKAERLGYPYTHQERRRD